ncbi:MAG: type II toxin-antitoxin system VapC family toxin [Rhizobium sp.]|nr:type II toxin-antitoxin system VapC family toxin [Rhizobium sp.]
MSARLGIDANVLLRIIVDDNAHQMVTVRELLSQLREDQAVFVNISVILEANWVLKKLYHYPRERILSFLQALLERREFEVAEYEAVGNALDFCRRSNVDFADALLAEMNRLAGCEKTLTFDKRAASRVPGMELLA